MKRLVLLAVLLAACYPGDQPTPHKPPPEDIDTSAFELYSDSLPPSGCADPPAYPNENARSAHKSLNNIRRWGTSGFYGISGSSKPYQAAPCAAFLPAVANAAGNHATYVSHWAGEPLHQCNAGEGHYEVPDLNCTHFTGRWPTQRMWEAGLAWPYVPHETGGEVQKGTGSDNAVHTPFTIALHEWTASVYHRIPLLDWRSRGAGYGEANAPKHFHTSSYSTNVMNFATFNREVAIPGAHDRGLMLWPPPDTQGHVRSFNACVERPSPPHPNGCDVGTPVLILAKGFIANLQPHPTTFGAPDVPDIRIYEWNPGVPLIEIPRIVLYKGNDPASLLTDDEYFVYQPWPLLASKWYLVQGRGLVETPAAPPNASTWSQGTIEWWFKTGG